MPAPLTGPDAPLPRSHCFISIAHGSTMRTLRIRIGILHTAVVAVALLGLWLVGSSAYLAFHDDLIASLMAREARMQYAYEDRIAALRGQVEHEASQKLVGQSTLEGQVRDLTRRAALLETRSSLVSDLAGKLGLGASLAERPVAGRGLAMKAARVVAAGDPLDNPVDGVATGTLPSEAAPARNPAPQRKPRPEAALETSAFGPRLSENGEGQAVRLRLAAVTEALEHIDAAQYVRIATIGDRARHRLDAIRAAVAGTGLSVDRLETRAGEAGSAEGGPYVPLDPAIVASPFGRAIDSLQADVALAQGLTRALPRLPFAKPMTGAIEVTSPYGARLDPFLGRPAMHTGVDLREDYGTGVRATAPGRVVSAGPAGGYGVMIEVDHGHGLATRYAHLSAVLVTPGQSVARGEVIGEVGATGRATGPHLHYETRIDGEAVDPMRFLQAGEKLAALDVLP